MKQIRSYLKNTDRACLVLCLLLSTLSVVTLTSISYFASKAQYSFFANYKTPLVQAFAAILGLGCAVVVSTVDYHSLANIWKFHAAITWGLVLLTFFIGYAPGNTSNQSWIALPMGLSLQPTELAKISFILTFALHLNQEGEHLNEPASLAGVLVHLCLPLLVIHFQGDDGTGLVFLLVGLTMLFCSGIGRKFILAGVGAVAVAVPVLWFFIMDDYQKNRVLALFHPQDYPDLLWQQNQASISIGAGQILGRGFFRVEHHSVPLAQNDFIFSYISEALGFVGSLLVLGLLFSLSAKMVATAFRSQDRLGALICTGVFGVLVWQSVINIGMNLTLLPVIGITLPLLTAGGTSVLTTYLLIGLELSVYRHNKRTLF
ncbi:MAG: FtsW/RodA/SpoVE family cell cycle protein [Pygmaiobacter massiliensis]|nr:FtsW/RodA/SpoVE family cell cycle protein [Pygmaiobacter massiliensis]